MKQSFPQCPRCNIPWKTVFSWKEYDAGSLYKCSFCETRFDNINQLLIYDTFLGRDGHHLVWDFSGCNLGEPKCYYGTYDQFINDKAIILPLLSFDVSQEKLRTYLTFS